MKQNKFMFRNFTTKNYASETQCKGYCDPDCMNFRYNTVHHVFKPILFNWISFEVTRFRYENTESFKFIYPIAVVKVCIRLKSPCRNELKAFYSPCEATGVGHSHGHNMAAAMDNMVQTIQLGDLSVE